MPPNSYDEQANQIIRDFIKTVVLIDDHWAESQNAPINEVIDPAQVDTVPKPIPPQATAESLSAILTKEGDICAAPPVRIIKPDLTYLREIGKAITDHGFLFTGFPYTDAKKDTAVKLASKSDILILDWLLGTNNPDPSLDLLEQIKASGSPRFVFILTDEINLPSIRQQIGERLGDEPKGTDLVFSCGHFSFSLKNKPQAGGDNTVKADAILEEAINGIRGRFGGLLQLAALELLGQYRACLHEVLGHFHEDTDLAFVLEWLEKDSPIRDSHSFNALAIDEWSARVSRRFPPTSAVIIKDETVSALVNKWKAVTTDLESCKLVLQQAIKGGKDQFPTDPDKVNALIDSLEEWMSSPVTDWPTSLKGLAKGLAWSKSANRHFSTAYMSIKKGVTSHIDELIKLDAIFQCQANLPPTLDQGTVLMAPDEKYLVCITPSCDCCRPRRTNNCYVFLSAEKIESTMLKKYAEGTVVAIRSKTIGNTLLVVTLKPTFTYKLMSSSLQCDMTATNTLGGEISFVLKPIAQLRPTRIQSLVSLVAGKAIEIGLDRSEILRVLCKSNNAEDEC